MSRSPRHAPDPASHKRASRGLATLLCQPLFATAVIVFFVRAVKESLLKRAAARVHAMNPAVLDLQHLRLTSSELAERLEAVEDPLAVQRLYVANNELTSLPSCIGRFPNLAMLYAGGNRLTDLPEQLFSLTRLSTLYLSSNSLARVSPAIGCLTGLTALSLHTNLLTSLPLSLSRLESLEVLYLKNNPLPPSIATNLYGNGTFLLRKVVGFFRRREPCRAAVRCVMMTRLRREGAPVASLAGLPRELLRCVAERVWATCDSDEWAALLPPDQNMPRAREGDEGAMEEEAQTKRQKNAD